MVQKQKILKLNRLFYPIAVSDWKTVMVDIVAGSAYPVDVYYETDTETGVVNTARIESFLVIKDFEEWRELDIRDCDEYVSSAKARFRLPPVVVCANFDQIIFSRVVFPTKSNIWKRDGLICQYTGDQLTKANASVDHIMPSSRGGGNTWENLVTCDRTLNTWKSDRTPQECGLKLIRKPFKPNNGLVFDFLRTEWEMFLGGGSYGDV